MYRRRLWVLVKEFNRPSAASMMAMVTQASMSVGSSATSVDCAGQLELHSWPESAYVDDGMTACIGCMQGWSVVMQVLPDILHLSRFDRMGSSGS
jgi:hypothetical protein